MNYKTLCWAALICSPLGLTAQTHHWEAVVTQGDAWQYIVPTSEPNAAWRATGFNGVWQVGASGFGYGDSDDNTTLTSPVTSVYIRKEFTINDTATVEEAALYMDFDDGFVAYLNGVEIARANMPAAAFPAYTDVATANSEARLYQGVAPLNYAIARTALRQGTNVLAIQIHNVNATSSDLSAIPFLMVGMRNSSQTYQATPSWFVPPVNNNTFSSNLPIIIINTLNGATIVDDPKTQADMKIIDNGAGNRNHFIDAPNNYNGMIGIELRGSSSQSFPKKPYGVETWASPNTDTSVSLLGMPAESDWVLNATYSDKSLMNNALSYYLFNQFGWYASRTRYVELFVNGEYLGVYILMEKIKRNRERVNIAKLTTTDTAGMDVTGGYILKIDKTTGSGGGGFYSNYQTSANTSIRVQFHYPKDADVQPQQAAYAQNAYNTFEDALMTLPLGDTVATNWRTYADEYSFIHYLILNEISKNVDGYRISTYFYKDRDDRNPKWIMGPAWDYDIAWGNANYCQATDTSGWAFDFNDYCGGGLDVPFWWDTMMTDSVFVQRLKCTYTHLRRGGALDTTHLHHWIDSTAALLNEAQQRNFQKWQILGTYVWPNPQPIPTTYAGEVDELKIWIRRRLGWIDAQLLDTSAVCYPAPPTQVNELTTNNLRLYPNPVQGELMLESDLPIEHVQIYNALGQSLWAQSFHTPQTNVRIANLSQILPAQGIYWAVVQHGTQKRWIQFSKI